MLISIIEAGLRVATCCNQAFGLPACPGGNTVHRVAQQICGLLRCECDADANTEFKIEWQANKRPRRMHNWNFASLPPASAGGTRGLFLWDSELHMRVSALSGAPTAPTQDLKATLPGRTASRVTRSPCTYSASTAPYCDAAQPEKHRYIVTKLQTQRRMFQLQPSLGQARKTKLPLPVGAQCC